MKSIKFISILTFTVILLVLSAFIVYAQLSVNVCHATSSKTNPYNLIVVSVRSVDDANGLNGHGMHEDDGWLPFTFEGVDYPGQHMELFGSIIDQDCNVIPDPTDTLVPTDTQVSPTATFTATSTDEPTPTETLESAQITNRPRNTSTPTYTLPPEQTNTLQPSQVIILTNTPLPTTPVETQPLLITSTPTTTSTNVPTSTSTPTDVVYTPTDTPFPPVPAVANDQSSYPGRSLGMMRIGSDVFSLYQGVNAIDGSLMLPSYYKGAALYQGTVWVHRLWPNVWINIKVGDSVYIQNNEYTVLSRTFIEYGKYPPAADNIRYIATCYSEMGEWAGVELYELQRQNWR